MAPAIEQANLPKQLALGVAAVPSGYLGAAKIWPYVPPLGGGVPPTTMGISVKVLLGAVRVAAAGPVTVDWGDGTTEVLNPTGHEVWGYHQYATPGVRTVSLTGAAALTQKINAGEVPVTPQFLVHGYDPTTGAFGDYQLNPSGHSAGTVWTGETTPFCDGVLRQHLFLSLVDVGAGTPDPAASEAKVAYDVSFGGQWWDVSGTDQVVNIGGSSGSDTVYNDCTKSDDYTLYGQRPYPTLVNVNDALMAAITPGTDKDPVLGKTWMDQSSKFWPVLLVTPSGQLASASNSSAAWSTVCQINVLDLRHVNDATNPAAVPGAWPPGFDLEMIPTILP